MRLKLLLGCHNSIKRITFPYKSQTLTFDFEKFHMFKNMFNNKILLIINYYMIDFNHKNVMESSIFFSFDSRILTSRPAGWLKLSTSLSPDDLLKVINYTRFFTGEHNPPVFTQHYFFLPICYTIAAINNFSTDYRP